MPRLASAAPQLPAITLSLADPSHPYPSPTTQVASMVASVSQLSTTNQIVRRRLRQESAQPTREEADQLR